MTPSLAVLREQIRTEVWAMTAGTLVNSVLGSEIVPRPIRGLGYRLLGIRTRTWNIFPRLRVAGRLRNVTIGERTFLNRECLLEAVGPITIGQECQFGPQVTVLTSHHPTDPDGRVSRHAVTRAVVIGDRVWIGARVVIVPGVTIGDDVVLAAGAVVTRDCPVPGTYAGVPARLLDRPTVRPTLAGTG